MQLTEIRRHPAIPNMFNLTFDNVMVVRDAKLMHTKEGIPFISISVKTGKNTGERKQDYKDMVFFLDRDFSSKVAQEVDSYDKSSPAAGGNKYE